MMNRDERIAAEPEEGITLDSRYKANLEASIAGYEADFRRQSVWQDTVPADLLGTKLKLLTARAVCDTGDLTWESYLTMTNDAIKGDDTVVMFEHDTEAVHSGERRLLTAVYEEIKGIASKGDAPHHSGL